MPNEMPTDISSKSNSDSAASSSIPLTSRLAVEIPKPKDWQAFQRNCTLLFRAELNDPNTQEYGRSGQKQRGIDLLGKRNGNPNHYVGVQCRRIENPLNEEEILAECRSALSLTAELKEIIFATTAPNDTGATDAAVAVENILQAEGHNLSVVVYGWGSLQTLIAVHDTAYAAFVPSIVGTSLPQISSTKSPSNDFATQVANQVVAQLRTAGLGTPPIDTGAGGSGNDEDPGLHARIDTFRDLAKEKQPLLAEKGLRQLLNDGGLDGKPWARYRIETNLGSIAIDLGREDEGATRYEAAFEIRPTDPKAIANLALARIIQGRFDEAMDLARQALGATPRVDHAIGYLLQAAARSSWQGDPHSLIPSDLVGSEYADMGLAEFLRRRNAPDWADRSLEFSRRHLKHDYFKKIRAIAVLSLVVPAGGIDRGGDSAVTFEELNFAADDLKAIAEHYLDIGFADKHDLFANISNAGLLLRVAHRHEECEALMRRALPSIPNEPQVRRLLALAQAALGRRAEALKTLADDNDAENQLVAAELLAPDDAALALERVLAMDTTALGPTLARIRWGLVGELALKSGAKDSLNAAVAALREIDPSDVTANLLELRGEKQAGLGDDAVHHRLRAMVSSLPAGVDMITRYFLAEELGRQGLPAEAAILLEKHEDLLRRSPAATLYLQNLAAARRDDAYCNAIAAATPAVREDPEILWLTATHSWNIGDLPDAYQTINTLLKQEPDNARALLLKIEILVRQDRSTELFAELDNRIEDLAWTRLQDQFRVASLLGHFGFIERAAAIAYRLFLEHRDNPRAWMTLSGLVLMEGREVKQQPTPLWDAPVVAANVAVDLKYTDGEKVFLVVEPDPKLRALDVNAWEPTHPLVRTLMGLTKGTRFDDPTGREGTVIDVRHKYVARLHYAMQNYESRFPEVSGFRKIPVNVEQEGGLDGLIEELKTRSEWIENEQDQYCNGPWPLGILARRIGADTIDVADGLVSQGIPLKVANGDKLERAAASCLIADNARKGCTLDLLTFWTAWRLKALETIETTCGPISLPQSVMDALRDRRAKMDFSSIDGLRMAHYAAGKLAVQEVGAEIVRGWRDDLDSAIAWANSHGNICPLVAGEKLAPALREHLRAGQSDVFDSLVLAIQNGLLLVSDDQPIREFSQLLGGKGGTWLHRVFEAALDAKHIDTDTFIHWTAQLLNGGQNYIGVSGAALGRALWLDAQSGNAPGHMFNTLIKVIGGKRADPTSHVVACVQCLRALWSDEETSRYRPQATGALLSQLLRDRQDDYGAILGTMHVRVRTIPELSAYIRAWARWHFISERVLRDNGIIGP